MDKFEKQIQENKILFDEHKADTDKMWANISAALDEPKVIEKPKKIWLKNLLRVAASIVIVFGLFSVINNLKQETNNIANQEFNDIETHYKALVNYQVNLINKNTKLSSEEKKEFLLFMNDLDKEYEILKLEIQKDVNAEQILEAIVLNYKKRIELIENLLKQINSSSKTKNNNAYIL